MRKVDGGGAAGRSRLSGAKGDASLTAGGVPGEEGRGALHTAETRLIHAQGAQILSLASASALYGSSSAAL